MNIKRQIRNIIFENLNSENTSTEYHTKYKFDSPIADAENQVGLTFELIVILGVTAVILSIMLYCIFILKSQNSKVSPSRTSIQPTYPEFRSTITQTSDNTLLSSESELELQRIQPTYPEYRSVITQTSDYTSSSGSELELRRFMINSEVVYGYLKVPPPEFRTARPKIECKCLSDRHSI